MKTNKTIRITCQGAGTAALPEINLESFLAENGKESEPAEKQYNVIVQCRTKKDQGKTIERLKRLGYKCHGSQQGQG